MAFCVTCIVFDDHKCCFDAKKLRLTIFIIFFFSLILFRSFFGHINYDVLLTQYTCICSDGVIRAILFFGTILRLNVDLLAIWWNMVPTCRHTYWTADVQFYVVLCIGWLKSEYRIRIEIDNVLIWHAMPFLIYIYTVGHSVHFNWWLN